MSFKSSLRPLEIVIDDDNYQLHCPRRDVWVDGEWKTRGLEVRNYEEDPLEGLAGPFDIPLIPESEWTERIEEMERTKSLLSQICDQIGLPCLDQNGTNYCWANGPVYCVQAIRAVQGQPMVLLSPASVAAPIKGYRNVGGWGTQALKYIVEKGIAPQSIWAPNHWRDPGPDVRARALEEGQKFKVTEWYDLQPRNFNQLMTCLLHRIPVAVGYNWWGHEVSAIDPVVISPGRYGVRIRNSWGMNWGDRGYSVLDRNKATPDDAVAPRVAMAG